MTDLPPPPATTNGRPGHGPGHRHGTVDLVLQAAEQTKESPLSIKATLRLLDDEGLPSGYLTGVTLTEAMQQVYAETLAPLHRERLRLFDAIEDWSLGAELLDRLTHAVIDPLFAELLGPRARLLHLCYEAVQRAMIVVPKSMWWTPVVGKRLVAANTRMHPRLRPILATLNNTTYHYVTNNVGRHLLPLSNSDRHPINFYQGLHALMRSGLDALLRPPVTEMPAALRQARSTGE